MSEPSQMFLRITAVEQQIALLRSGGGGGRSDDTVGRIAKLEAATDHIQADLKEVKADVRELRKDVASIRTVDFRILFGATIAATLGLAAVMARGFHWF